jgi:molybdopterin molybdotransferase
MTPAEAARLIISHFQPLEPERRPLREALDAVLAEDVASPIDLPPWDNSAMDGYAIRSVDLTDAETDLDVIETVPAGQFPAKVVGRGQATRIFTGAPLPQGADTVIRQEDTEEAPPLLQGEGVRAVRIRNTRDAKKNIRRRGEDIRKGALVLPRGTALGPAQLGVLASMAHDQPLVHRAPRVAFMGSGDEIVDLDQKADILAGAKIASSNSYTLDALIRRAAAQPVNLGLARDTKESLREHLSGARPSRADLVVTTAGVSVGEHDLVREVLQELGGELKFWRIGMRPGAPVGFGMLNGIPWIGLPGNPVSTMVTFELFVRPAMRRLQGHGLPFRRTVPVVVTEAITLGPKLRHYLRAIVAGAEARLTGPQGSGILTSMARANALLIVPADMPAVPVGTTLQALLLDDPQHVAEPPY